MQLVNPRLSVVILGDSVIEITDAKGQDDNKIIVRLEIEKDREEEPNICDLWISNLSESTQAAIAAASDQSAPVEIYLTPKGVDELALYYVGEIEDAKNKFLDPGHETFIHCVSQKTQHQNLYIEKTFAAGTAIDEIINEFLLIINLPTQVYVPSVDVAGRRVYEGLPTTGILLSQSFTGPAFPVLKRFVYDLGLYCWIMDGVLHISSIYDPQDQEIIEIQPDFLLSAPQETTREDDEFVMMRTVTEVTNLAPLERVRKKKTRRIRIRAGKGNNFYYTPIPSAVGNGDYVEYEAVQTVIQGMSFELAMHPKVNPDSILRINTPELKDKLWRVNEILAATNNERYDDIDMTVSTDYYEQSVDLL